MTTHPFKFTARLRYGDALSQDERDEAGEVPVYGSGGEHGRHSRPNTRGPVIVVGRKGSVGALHWSDSPVWVADTAYAIDDLVRPASLRWVYYFLMSSRLSDLTQDVGVPGLSREAVHALRCPVVSCAEQHRVAEFLDRECERIEAATRSAMNLSEVARDAYFARARELILTPDFPRVLVKRVARTGTGHTPSRDHPEYWNEDECRTPWFGLADVWQIRDDTIDVVSETAERVSELGLANSAAVVHPAGTIILSRTASVGFVAQMGLDMAVTQDFMTWTCGPLLLPEYLLHALRACRPEILQLVQGSTHKTIYMPDLLNIKIPLPDVAEQRAIVADLQPRLEARRGVGPAHTALEGALAAYRQSLIREAVTGEIDVSRASEEQMEERLHAVIDGQPSGVAR